jgi:hypothetical protein
MESTDLFSHPQKPEHISTDRDSAEPVKNPEFSDGDARSVKPTS